MGFSKDLKYAWFRLTHPGNACQCTFCGKTYSKFRHMGMKSPVFARHKMNVGGYRKNARCPNCFSSDRSRLMYLFFQYRTEVYRKPTKMLHISPEVEVGKLFADKPNIEYIAGTIEPDPYMELHPIHLDVTDITFPENQFDLVICNHVIEHVPDDRKAMQEIFRVLKPGAFAVLQVPIALDLETTIENPKAISPKQRFDTFGQADHVRLYGIDYFDRLEEAGFDVERDHPVYNKWIEKVERFCLAPHEEVIVARKSKFKEFEG